MRRTGWDDPVGAFAAVGEMLWCIRVVDDQLRTNCPATYNASLTDEPGPWQLLSGLRYVPDRITHAVDQVSYAAATATRGFDAAWAWTSLPPRADGRQAAMDTDYEAVVAGQSS